MATLRRMWLLLLALILLAGCTKPQPPVDFDAWFAEHKRTCPQCAQPVGAMCDEANKRLEQAWDQLDLDVSPRDGSRVK